MKMEAAVLLDKKVTVQGRLCNLIIMVYFVLQPKDGCLRDRVVKMQGN